MKGRTYFGRFHPPPNNQPPAAVGRAADGTEAAPASADTASPGRRHPIPWSRLVYVPPTGVIARGLLGSVVFSRR